LLITQIEHISNGHSVGLLYECPCGAHFAQTQVGGVSQNDHQQQYWILCWIGGLEMNEMASETYPVVHFLQ
jgi:hypothetical protein